MSCYNRLVTLKQFTHLCLCKPTCFIFQTNVFVFIYPQTSMTASGLFLQSFKTDLQKLTNMS